MSRDEESQQNQEAKLVYKYCQKTGRIELRASYPKFDPRSHKRIFDQYSYLNPEMDEDNTRTLLQLRDSLKRGMNEQILAAFANNDTDEAAQIAQSQSDMTAYVSGIIDTIKQYSADNIVTNNISGLIDYVRSTVETFSQLWKTTQFLASIVLAKDFILCVVLSLLIYAFSTIGFPKLGISLALSIYSLMASTDTARKYSSVLAAMYMTWNVAQLTVPVVRVNVAVAQGDDTGYNWKQLLPILLVGLAILTGVNISDLSETTFHSFAKKIDANAKIVRGIPIISSGVKDAFDSICETFGVEFCGFGSKSHIPDDILAYVDALASFDISKKQSIVMSYEVCKEIQDLYKRSLELRKLYRHNRELAMFLAKYDTIISNLYGKACSVYPTNTKNRVEPVVIMLTGGSGVGKSSLLYHLGAVVMSELGTLTADMTDAEIHERISKCIYARMIEQDFWDGYKDQVCVLVDDFGQLRDSASNPNMEYMEIVRMSNTFPYALHMADIDLKDSTTFKSRVVVATTNLTTLNANSINCVDAVIRRVDMPFWVKVRKELADSHGRLLPMYKTGAIDLTVYEFYSWDPATGTIGSTPIDFFGLVSLLKTKLKIKEERFKANSADLASFARNYLVRAQAQSGPVSYKVAGDIISFDMSQEVERYDPSYRDTVREMLQPAVNRAKALASSMANGDYIFTIPQYMKEVFKETTLWITEQVKKFGIFNSCMTVVAGLFIGYGIYKLVSSYKETPIAESGKPKGFSPRIKAESGKPKSNGPRVKAESGKPKEVIPKVRAESGKPKDVQPKCVAQSWCSENTEQLVQRIRKNQMQLSFYYQGKELDLPKVNIAFIQDRYAAINTHYLRLIDVDGLVCKLHRPYVNEGIYMDWDTVKKTARQHMRGEIETDISIIEFGRKVPMYSTILPYLINKDEISCLIGTRCALLVPGKHEWHAKFGNLEKIETQNFNVPSDSTIYRSRAFLTNISSAPGECGGLYFLDSNLVSRKVIGFHFAGLPGGGCAVPLVFEDFKWMEPSKAPEVCALSQAAPVILEAGNVSYEGVSENPNFLNTGSKIIATPIQNEIFETGMAPSYISAKLELDSPMGKGIQKQFKDTPLIDETILSKAVLSYKQKLAECTFGPMKVLDFEEAVQGNGENFISGINRSTSAGYPYALTTKGKGKQEWFGKTDWEFNTPKGLELREKIEADIAQMEKGHVIPYVFADTLKDETLPVEKVAIKKTRVFAMAPIDYVVTFRKYFLSFTAQLMENRIDSESCVGIRAQSLEWDKLAHYLLDYGNNMIAGDFSNFDGTLHIDILWSILEVIESFYEVQDGYRLEDKAVRHSLWEATVNSLHICKDQVYKLNHGQPSGNPLTAVMNSMYNSIVMRYAYYDICSKGDFNAHVRMVSYGDDNLLSIDDSTIEEYNQLTITQSLAKIGMIYTDETKSTSEAKCKSLQECGFLKRGFRLEPQIGLYVAPLKLSSILECFNWIQKTENIFGVLEQNARMAHAELSMHDQDTFDQVTSKIKRVIFKKYGKVLSYENRKTYLFWIREDTLTAHVPDLVWT